MGSREGKYVSCKSLSRSVRSMSIHGIEANHIVTLTGYMAQAILTKRVLALADGLHVVDSRSIDG